MKQKEKNQKFNYWNKAKKLKVWSRSDNPKAGLGISEMQLMGFS